MTEACDTLVAEIADGACTVTFNRPNKYYCFNNAMIHGPHRRWNAVIGTRFLNCWAEGLRNVWPMLVAVGTRFLNC